MFVRNILRPGDYLVPVPLGVPFTLEYNDNGALANVYLGYREDKVLLERQIKETVITCVGVPFQIPIVGGTSWVEGVLYSRSHFLVSGDSSSTGAQARLEDCVTHPDRYRFYACNVSSIAAKFYGAGPIRQWLKLNKFETLVGQLMPAKITKSSFENLWSEKKFGFEYPLMMYYFIFRTKEVSILNTLIQQDIVTSVTKEYTTTGYIRARVKCKKSTYVLDYYQVVKNNIQKGDLIYISNHDLNNILKSISFNPKSNSNRSQKIKCDYCGKSFDVTKNTMCDDTNCFSRRFNECNRLLEVFAIPPITFDQYTELVKSGTILTISDILDIDSHKNYTLSASISSIVRAVVPEEIVRNDDEITSFVNKCNNNKDTFKYYIDHLDRASYDFGAPLESDFLCWLIDPQNVSELKSILDNPRYQSNINDVLFDGPPIFRDKKIYITGKFVHGNTNYMSSLIASYGAQCTNVFDVDCDLVLVGGILENVSSKCIKQARNMNIPVMDEKEFFARYDIDTDIQANLL